MIGAIAGDIIGSIYEGGRRAVWSPDFPLFDPRCRFTDDTVLTIALADSILSGRPFAGLMKAYYRRYPRAGYGGNFIRWASSEDEGPYNSWGNGSAMRVSPVAYASETLDEVLWRARLSAEVTHDHLEGIKGAQAIAAAIFLARAGKSKEEIEVYLTATFGYRFDEPLDAIRERGEFHVSCQKTVPHAVTAFLDSDGFEDAIRKAIWVGGDSDTIACMAGGIAQAHYGCVPRLIVDRVYEILDEDLGAVALEFCRKYDCG
jgi:ADP-ribosylglycohydrolase